MDIRIIPCTFNICALCDSPRGVIERPVIAFLYFTDGGKIHPVIFDPEHGAEIADSLGGGLKGYIFKD